ncbi:MAG: hypothetical protein IPJ01_12180, partial [Micavibrio sp.]|nr:hypothetical protein [Micavibrio sp.]
LSMLIQSHGMKPGETREAKHIEDEILQDLKKKFPGSHKTLREDFNFLAGYAKDVYNLNLKYAGMNKNDWIAKALNSETPFMTSTSNALTSFGHIILIRGVKADADGVAVYANDPYGCHPYKTKKSGEAVLYSADLFPFDDGNGTQKKYHTLSYK